MRATSNGEPTHPEQWSCGYDAGFKDGEKAAYESLQSDAERYRWLRSRFDACAASCTFAEADDGKAWRSIEQNDGAGRNLDTQIDAARSELGDA